MLLNICFINVGASVGNRSLVCDVFSYVDVFFVVDPPVNGHGNCVDGDVGDFVFVSGGDGLCDVHVYIRRSLLGLFDVVWADARGMILELRAEGEVRRIGGIYLRPTMSVADVENAVAPYVCCHILAGDMNARHDRWGHVADVGGHNSHGRVLHRMLADMDFMVPSIPTHDGISVIDLCAFRWTPHKYRLSLRAGLPHAAQIVKIAADMDRLPPLKPNFKKAKWDHIATSLNAINAENHDIWHKARAIVDDITRKSHGRDRCRWWTDDLERMRDDTRRLRRISVMDRDRRLDFILARKVYKAAVIQARYDSLGSGLATATDPEIYKFVHVLDTSRTLPAMDDGSGRFHDTHEAISDLIAAQLAPVDPVPWQDDDSLIWDSVAGHFDDALRMSPSNTATSFDDMSYPFVRFWSQKARSSLMQCLEQSIRLGNEDWHQGEVVLIQKANKPRYDVVKGWRMIHLLPVLTKIAERMVLLEVTKHLELEDTQFGSRRKRGTHDACAVIYEFLKHHKGYATALLSMDVEGGFDRIDIDLLADLLVARSCPSALVNWIRHWASQRTIRFRFNGRISRSYYLSRGIPQGSPLSPLLFGAYVADIFRPRLRYSPSVRSVTVSYVDDGGVVVAGESVRVVKNRLEEVFGECSEVARGRGMGFSGLKTEWIGFGNHDWGACSFDGNDVFSVHDLRVLGMRFAVDGRFGKHVDYWIERALAVRGRISAISRRFGGAGGIGAWEVMRLVQGAFLPVVEYGLEFVADDKAALHRIEVVVRDCLRSLFRMPPRLANNILHSECGIPPSSIRADYYRGRFAQRFLDYGYCSNFPWHGAIRSDWVMPGMVESRMDSDETLDLLPRCHIPPDKVTGEAEGRRIVDSLSRTSTVVGFVHGSKGGTGCGCAWIAYAGCSVLRQGSCSLPVMWDINSCELFAILSLLRDLLPLAPCSLVIFSDSQIAVRTIRDMQNIGLTSGVWHAFAPLLSHFPDTVLRWIPGHVGILGNEITDRMAKRACARALEPGRFAHINFGFGGYTRIRERRLAGWRNWHANEGHDYYKGLPRDFRHLRLLSRLDFYALVRIRSGTGLVGHDGCIGRKDRYHWTSCNKFLTMRPARDTLHDNSKIAPWIKWIKHHDMLGLGIPSNTQRHGNVVVAYGNPFDGTACIIRDGRYITVDVASPTYRCDDCGLVHATAACPLPAFRMDGVLYFVAKDCTTCPVCSLTVGNGQRQRNHHFGMNTLCREVGQRLFWHGVKLLWDRFSPAEKVKLAVKWLYPAASGRVQCPGCQASYCDSGSLLSRHLRVVLHEGCWSAVWIRFFADCDAVGDDEDAKLIVLKVLGIVDLV